MPNTLLPRRFRHAALSLVAAGSMAVSGAIVATTPAAAADPVTAVCFRTDPNNVTVSVDGATGLSGPAVLTIKDANGVVISTQAVTLLNGVITVPPTTVPLPAGSNSVTATVTTVNGVVNTANTPCNELPAGSVVGGYQALAGVGAVYLNFVATGGTAPGFLTVFPTGSSQPGVSSLNYLPGPNVANAVISQVGTGGQVTIRNTSAGSVDLVGDVGGYFVGGLFQGVLLPGAYQPLRATRIADSRRGFGLTTLMGQTPQTLRVAGVAGVPANARSVVVNLTAVNGTRHSHITAYPTGTAVPNASNVNYTGSKPAANLAVVPVGTNGSINVKNGIDPTNVRAVLVTVTTTQEEVSGDIVAYPSGTPATTTSVLTFIPRTDMANLAIVRVGTDGMIRLTNRSGGPTHLVVDVAGYFVGNTIQLGS